MAKNLSSSVNYVDVCKGTLRLAENQKYSIILADKLKLSVATLQQSAATVQMQANLFLSDLKLMTRPMAATLALRVLRKFTLLELVRNMRLSESVLSNDNHWLHLATAWFVEKRNILAILNLQQFSNFSMALTLRQSTDQFKQ
jgi:hypothetical protein